MIYQIKPYPWYATLELTTRCNSNCSYCVRNKETFPKEDITLDKLSTILATLKQTKVEKITLGGWGEPLLYPFFDQAVTMIKEALPKAKVKIFTNGILIHEHLSSLLKLDEITVSLNHDSKETYLQYNKVDKYNQVSTGILELLNVKGNSNPAVSIQLLKTPESNLVKFKKQWQPIMNKNDFVISQPLESQAIIPHEFYPCYDAKTLLMVTLEGDAYCCCRSWTAGKSSNVYIGNLLRDTMATILSSYKLKQVQNTQQYGEHSKLTPCNKCDIWVKNKNQYQYLGNKWRLA
jgi:sulfatase maturation enzyme AslB (radical SAM superfamily)